MKKCPESFETYSAAAMQKHIREVHEEPKKSRKRKSVQHSLENDEKAAKNCPSYLIWSIFTRRRELQKVQSLEGRAENSPGAVQRIIRSAPASLDHRASVCCQACSNIACTAAVSGSLLGWDSMSEVQT